MKKRILAMLLAATMIMGVFAGCGGSDEGENAASGENIFNDYSNSIVVGLNPIINATAPDNKAHIMLQEPLVRLRGTEDNKTECVAGAAESWDISPDGLTYTFHFHKDAKWSDGEPLTAKDYEYTLKLMADPATAATNAWLFDGLIENFGDALYSNGKTPEDIAVKAIDDYTLEIKLENAATYFLEQLGSLYPVRQDKYEEWGDKYGSSVEYSLCSGPFKVETWSQNTELYAVKNENYWNADAMSLDGIRLKVIQESATAVQAFIGGDIDVVSTTDNNWGDTIEKEGIAETHIVPNNAPEWLAFNCSNEYFKNVKVRQAFSAVIDREAFVNDLWDGKAYAIYSAIPDHQMVGEESYTDRVGGANNWVKTIQTENPDPKALLVEGLEELGMDPDPSKVTVRYASRGTSEISKKMAEWFKQEIEEALGVTVQIDMMEWNVMWEKIDAGDYDIATAGWGPYYNEPSAILQLYHPVNGYFDSTKSGWVDAESEQFGALLEEAALETDPQKKAELYLDAEELLVGRAVLAPTYLSELPTYVANRVDGYLVTTCGHVDWTQVSITE